MIGSTRRVSVFAYGAPCDMRKSFDALSGLVTQAMGHDVLGGDIFLFVSRTRKHAKALYFDGTGLCVVAKRLEQGRFSALWADGETRALRLTLSELALFFEGSQAVGRRPLAPKEVARMPVFALARAASR